MVIYKIKKVIYVVHLIYIYDIAKQYEHASCSFETLCYHRETTRDLPRLRLEQCVVRPH